MAEEDKCGIGESHSKTIEKLRDWGYEVELINDKYVIEESKQGIKWLERHPQFISRTLTDKQEILIKYDPNFPNNTLHQIAFRDKLRKSGLKVKEYNRDEALEMFKDKFSKYQQIVDTL